MARILIVALILGASASLVCADDGQNGDDQCCRIWCWRYNCGPCGYGYWWMSPRLCGPYGYWNWWMCPQPCEPPQCPDNSDPDNGDTDNGAPDNGDPGVGEP